MSDADDNLGVGGGLPPLSPLRGPSLEDDEKAMKKGKGVMLAAMLAALAVPIIGVVLYLALSGGDEQYRTLGRNVNGLHDQSFKAFWGCSLRGANLEEIRSNTDLSAQINTRAGNGRGRYAQHVRDECMPMLEEIEPALSQLIPPEEMRSQVQELGRATGELRSGWSGFVAHLEGLEEDPYDEREAREHVNNIAKGWYDYRRSHKALNDAIRERIEE
ncbi:MAG: hypothetical protein AAGF12_00795 [Myxococcota bacterium]